MLIVSKLNAKSLLPPIRLSAPCIQPVLDSTGTRIQNSPLVPSITELVLSDQDLCNLIGVWKSKSFQERYSFISNAYNILHNIVYVIVEYVCQCVCNLLNMAVGHDDKLL